MAAITIGAGDLSENLVLIVLTQNKVTAYGSGGGGVTHPGGPYGATGGGGGGGNYPGAVSPHSGRWWIWWWSIKGQNAIETRNWYCLVKEIMVEILVEVQVLIEAVEVVVPEVLVLMVLLVTVAQVQGYPIFRNPTESKCWLSWTWWRSRTPGLPVVVADLDLDMENPMPGSS